MEQQCNRERLVVDVPEGTPGAQPVILVVDDFDPVRHLICRVLKIAGFRVLEAGSGYAALEIADTDDGTIALLLTDISMPGMNGNELISRFGASHPETPVVVLTAEPSTVRPGPHAVLEKPVQPENLVRTINESLKCTRTLA